MSHLSPVNFPGSRRVHIALAVKNLSRSRTFYEMLLGVPPTKVRPGYIKFEPDDPSVNLTLNEVSDTGRAGPLPMHYGIQVKSTQAVRDAITRFSEGGIGTEVEEHTTCCYAVQDKVWVADPEGNQWEVFVVLDADATSRKDEGSTCCAGMTVNNAASSSCC